MYRGGEADVLSEAENGKSSQLVQRESKLDTK